MLVTLVPLVAWEPGDQDSIKEAFLECFLKDEKGTVDACPLFIFSTRCCLDLNLSCCEWNRPMKERWITWVWSQGHPGQLWLAPSRVTRLRYIAVTMLFLLLNQTWPAEHFPSNSQCCRLLTAFYYQACSWPMASFPSSIEQNKHLTLTRPIRSFPSSIQKPITACYLSGTWHIAADVGLNRGKAEECISCVKELSIMC